eukprot:RCo011301
MADEASSSSATASGLCCGSAVDVDDGSTLILVCKYGAQSFPVVYTGSSVVMDIKLALQALTNVHPARQKLLGLSKGKLLQDDAQLSELGLRQNQKFILMGTPDDQIPQVIVQPEFSEDDQGYEEDSANDFDIATSKQNLDRVRQKIASTTITLLAEPRPGKPLLVLDIDLTIYDCKSASESIAVLKRPFLDTFLSLIYRHYDLAFWSQTHWKWVEAKLTEMGLLSNPNFKILFILDQSAMPRVEDKHYYHRHRKKRPAPSTGAEPSQEPKFYEVKPLQLIWDKLPQHYSPRNTLHVDDLSRNFVMNQRNGLKISAYRNANQTHRTDRELLFLGYYLTLIRECQDFTTLDHSEWRTRVFSLTNSPG